MTLPIADPPVVRAWEPLAPMMVGRLVDWGGGDGDGGGGNGDGGGGDGNGDLSVTRADLACTGNSGGGDGESGGGEGGGEPSGAGDTLTAPSFSCRTVTYCPCNADEHVATNGPLVAEVRTTPPHCVAVVVLTPAAPLAGKSLTHALNVPSKYP